MSGTEIPNTLRNRIRLAWLVLLGWRLVPESGEARLRMLTPEQLRTYLRGLAAGRCEVYGCDFPRGHLSENPHGTRLT